MSSRDEPPADAPPSYAVATGSSTASQPSKSAGSTLHVPDSHNGIPHAQRRSMEDEQRPLPTGWVRQFDPQERHQFFVNTNVNPPRSIWHHPYDDDEYLSTLTAEQREQVQENDRLWREDHDHSADDASIHDSKGRSPSDAKRLEAEGTGNSSGSAFPELPPRPSQTQRKSASGAKLSLGNRLKDKVTGTTHEQRVEERQRRAEQEREYYEAHQQLRQAMQVAMQTGEPQPLGRKDREGREIYVTPPSPQYGGYGGYGGYGPSYGRYDGYGNANYYSPYAQGAPYYSNDPTRRYITPQSQYYRPGFSGGAPLAAGAGAGLLGGLLLGGLLF